MEPDPISDSTMVTEGPIPHHVRSLYGGHYGTPSIPHGDTKAFFMVHQGPDHVRLGRNTPKSRSVFGISHISGHATRPGAHQWSDQWLRPQISGQISGRPLI